MLVHGIETTTQWFDLEDLAQHAQGAIEKVVAVASLEEG
ncbi:hypothetical protein Pla163_11250 [Planctomycetes bacterium Pla163]|uniref:Uncharacterized protein n=1 Tax=Rohdeia mirabilis TaxID=2528008 RepID=A0A518CXS1_9BACT|nr:hypothetical protein Pla163_11250 [Planctomycetes bacterium Pla163]